MMRSASFASALLLMAVASCDAGPASPEASSQREPSGNGPAIAGQTAANESSQREGLDYIWSVPSPTPTAGEIEADGAARRIRFSAGAPVVIEPLMMTGRKDGVVAECAVRINGRIIGTIGEEGSVTEVVQCYKLVEAGALPTDGGRRRIGLIYSAGTPNNYFNMPVVLVEDGGGGWTFDEVLFKRFNDTDEKLSIKGMARALGTRDSTAVR